MHDMKFISFFFHLEVIFINLLIHWLANFSWSVYKSTVESLKVLWIEKNEQDIFRAAMSLQCFEIIRQSLRIGNK